MRTEERFPITEFGEIVPGARVRRRRRRRWRGRFLATVLILALLAGGGWIGLKALGTHRRHKAAKLGFGFGDGQSTYLWMIRRADDLSRRSDMLVLFALDARGRQPFALLIPSQAQSEVPGHGLDSIGRAFSFGGMPLQALTVDNMLGIKLDQDVALADTVVEKMVAQVGGLDIDVTGTLMKDDGQGNQIPAFEPGHQHMDGPTVRAYLEYQGADETELSRLARAQQVWDALITAWGHTSRATLAGKLRALGHEYGTGLETGATPEELAQFFIAFARAGSSARVFATVPVSPVGAGGDEQALKIDDAGVAGLVSQYLAGSVPPRVPANRIQILNGNGMPQVGEAVGLKLIPAGYRVIIDQNASTFDFPFTRIVVYSRDDQSLAAAKRIRDLLGVGQIEVGLQNQTIVDVTIVVGHDFRQRG